MRISAVVFLASLLPFSLAADSLRQSQRDLGSLFKVDLGITIDGPYEFTSQDFHSAVEGAIEQVLEMHTGGHDIHIESTYDLSDTDKLFTVQGICDDCGALEGPETATLLDASILSVKLSQVVSSQFKDVTLKVSFTDAAVRDAEQRKLPSNGLPKKRPWGLTFWNGYWVRFFYSDGSPLVRLVTYDYHTRRYSYRSALYIHSYGCRLCDISPVEDSIGWFYGPPPEGSDGEWRWVEVDDGRPR